MKAPAMPSMPTMAPRASIQWDKAGASLKGTFGALAPGTKVTVTIEATVTGYGMHDYGCALDLEVKELDIAKAGTERSLVSLAAKMGKGGK